MYARYMMWVLVAPDLIERSMESIISVRLLYFIYNRNAHRRLIYNMEKSSELSIIPRVGSFLTNFRFFHEIY